MFPTRSDTNRTVQPQKMTRGLKFRIKVVERLYYPYSENKGADQLSVTAQLICVFVLAYAKSRFSYNEAQMIPLKEFQGQNWTQTQSSVNKGWSK